MSWRDDVEREYPEETRYFIDRGEVNRMRFWTCMRMQSGQPPILETSVPLLRGDFQNLPRGFLVVVP